jgi:hypothetical protein
MRLTCCVVIRYADDPSPRILRFNMTFYFGGDAPDD